MEVIQWTALWDAYKNEFENEKNFGKSLGEKAAEDLRERIIEHVISSHCYTSLATAHPSNMVGMYFGICLVFNTF